MKKLSTLLFLCLFSSAVFAQSLQQTSVRINKDLTWTRTFGTVTRGLGKTASCGPDTVTYPYGKATQIQAVALNATTSGNLFAQYYPAPQSITISGFEFYAWQSTGTGTVVNITCNIYAATLDSLPNGSPLRSVTVAVDSTFGSGNLTSLLKSAVFSSPITFNGGGYVLTLETSSSTNVSVATNSYTYGDGGEVFASSVRIGSTMYRSYDINVGGVPFDADFMLHPYVTYNMTANFTISGCNTGLNTITFTNTSSPVLFNSFYNYYALYNIAYVGMRWDFGDSTGVFYQQNGSHSYSYRANHDVTLKDTIYAWRRGCVDVVTKTNFAAPAPPNVFNNGPLCAGDTLKLDADSINGATYSWIGPGFSSNKKSNFIAAAQPSHSGGYQARIVQNGCTSVYANTNALVYPLPQKPNATNNGPKCVGDSVTFFVSNGSGLKHDWTGPKGFTSTLDNPGIGTLDTTHTGKYIVILSDANCSSVPDTTDFFVYPPPMPPVLSTFGNDTLCFGDTLKLKGSSVPGAVFNWTGPDGFISSFNNPTRSFVQLIHSGYYKTAVKIGSCTSQPDSILIIVNDLPNTSAITGSDTSKETLSKVYSVSGSSGSTYTWTVTGGTIQSGQGSSSITVLWPLQGTGKVSVYETNSSGCRDTAVEMNVTISDIDPEGIAILDDGSSVKMYPNPASGQFVLKFELKNIEGVKIGLSNILGQTLLERSILSSSGAFSEAIDIHALKPGIYFVKVSLGNNSETLRLVVE